MKIRYYLLLILLFISTNAFALDSCVYTDDYIEYMNMSNEERKNVIEPIKCKDFEEQTIVDNRINDFKSSLSGSSTDSRYSSKDEGYVTSPKNQYYDGLCWDFATIGNVESLALKNNLGTYDLSEAHMAYTLIAQLFNDAAGKMGKYDSEGLGGQVYYSPTYFFNNKGMLTESELPYKYPNLDKITSSQYKQGRQILTVNKYTITNVIANQECSTSSIKTIKENIVKNGSVQTTVYMNESLLSNNYYYKSTTQNSKFANHAVLIVGWDDNMSKDLFNGATKDGGWIVKNSWGSTWGDQGYYYISYEDNFVCTNISYYEGISTDNYDNTYNSSELIGTNNKFDSHVYVASKFDKDDFTKEKIKKVSFSLPYRGTYKVYLSKASNYQDDSNWELLGQGSNQTTYGIDSIFVDKEIDDDFTIIVEYKSSVSSSVYMLSSCDSLLDTETYMTYETGKNFVSNDLVNWTDMASGSTKCKPNIYVYTDNYVDTTSDIILTNLENNNNQVSINYTRNTNNDYSYKIMRGDQDVTDNFEVNVTSDKFVLLPDNTISGTFDFIVTVGDKSTSLKFKLDEVITSKSSDVTLDDSDDLFIVKIPTNTTLTSDDLAGKLDINNTSIRIVNEGNINVTKVYTGARIVTNTKEYRVVIKGDTSSDGNINSGDLMKIVKHLKNTNLLDAYQYKAADVNNDNIINSGDLMKIVKYLKGTTTF